MINEQTSFKIINNTIRNRIKKYIHSDHHKHWKSEKAINKKMRI